MLSQSYGLKGLARVQALVVSPVSKITESYLMSLVQLLCGAVSPPDT